MTFRFKTHESRDLDGFVKTLTSNGYQVTFREGGNSRILMCDISDDKCVIRNNDEEVQEASE